MLSGSQFPYGVNALPTLFTAMAAERLYVSIILVMGRVPRRFRGWAMMKRSEVGRPMKEMGRLEISCRRWWNCVGVKWVRRVWEGQ